MEISIISELWEFEEEMHDHDYLVFFVHSPWSAYSKYGLEKFHTLMERHPEIHWVIIDNRSGKSFVYEWLQGQIGKHIITGNGEFFGVRQEALQWFVWSSYLPTIEEIEEKGYFRLD